MIFNEVPWNIIVLLLELHVLMLSYMYMYVYFLLATHVGLISALSVHRPKNHRKTWHLNYMSNETFISMFPNLNTLASICLTIPIGTALVERTRLRNLFGEVPLDEDSYRVT